MQYIIYKSVCVDDNSILDVIIMGYPYNQMEDIISGFMLFPPANQMFYSVIHRESYLFCIEGRLVSEQHICNQL